MKAYFKQYIKNLDYVMLIAYIALTLLGLVMVYSSSQMVAIRIEKQDPDYFYNKQFFFLKIAWILFAVMAIFPFKRWSNKLIMTSMIAVLLVLFAWLKFFGIAANGSQSWINVFGITTFQPSEYAKLFVIIYFAGVFYNKSKKYNSIQELKINDVTYPVVIWMFILIMVGLETDLGGVMILGVIAVATILTSGIAGKTLRTFMVTMGVVGTLAVSFLLILKWDSIFSGGRTGRITSFLNPFEYAETSGFQIVNGYYAIGSGGVTGLGLGQSVQKLGYLPEPHTDFIMAIVAEELGVFGVGVIILGLGYIALKGYWIAMNSKDVMARMLAAGVATWIAFQTVVNIGGLTGLMPLTGVTLPFISYGGTSLLMLSLAVGILLNVSTIHKMESKKS